MKMKYFFATAVLAMLFAGCSKEDTTPEDNGIVTDPTGTAWVSLKVNSPTKAFNTTRSLHDPNVMTGSEAETNVSSFLAIFFDKDEKLTVAKSFSTGDDEFGNPNQPQGDAGKAFQVPAASKKILIVANPSAAFNTAVTSAAAGTTYDAINAIITDDDAAAILGEITTADHFMMTNAKGGLEPSNDDGSPKDLVLYSNKSAAEASPLSINIDRVVAKVRLFVVAGSGGSAVESEVANIYFPGWALSVTNKKFYPVSARVKTYMESGTANSVGPGVPRAACITPFDQYHLGSYRIDPNHGSTQPALGPETDWSDASWNAYKQLSNIGACRNT